MSSGLPSLQQQLDRVRDMQGKDPLPSGSQSPFSNSSPPPSLDSLPAVIFDRDPDVPDEWLDPELDPGARMARGLPMPESPLIPKEIPVPTPPTGPNGAIAALLEQGLVVIGRLGAWKGREVQLSDAEEKKVRGIVLLAIRRELDADLSAVSQKRPRRPRMPQNQPDAVTLPPTPKRRGRPRGSLLRTQP